MATALAVFAALVVGLFAFVAWHRRGERAPDRPGRPTAARFHGGEELVTQAERDAEADEGFGVYGEGVARVLARELARSGLEVDEPSAADFGWTFRASRGKARCDVLVGRVEDENATEWLLTLNDPRCGGPGDPAFVAPVDEALRALGFADAKWEMR